MDFSFGSPEILLDASPRPTVSGLLTVQPVPAETASEFNIASFNMERFYNDKADADNPGSSAVTVTRRPTDAVSPKRRSPSATCS